MTSTIVGNVRLRQNVNLYKPSCRTVRKGPPKCQIHYDAQGLSLTKANFFIDDEGSLDDDLKFETSKCFWRVLVFMRFAIFAR